MASNAYDYVLTKTAENDIDSTFAYISKVLKNKDAASLLADEFEKKIDDICKHPLTGRLVENDFLKREEVRHFVVKNYIVYYLINDIEKEIVVLRFVYSGRNQDKIIKEL
ncbi:Plasmid stabilization system protein ParE [Acetitomaculum ruminis DSM 5522]|uniref:Plasmid stabilization system protein ParE n=1 Tax=Acetitomaculum ruminis DSM 5522 TaxID=1120918 RepID=A0A1I0ZSN0_9FIRM|nr:type II toxin-antitoxin system RelE/ParE family toxin [Acetitomaculum ruminis]SFB28567.1 Plasmid stabilization system protein ParE [Acetitomaculum ruminis DSM 5522]